jgi:hypothetical protein
MRDRFRGGRWGTALIAAFCGISGPAGLAEAQDARVPDGAVLAVLEVLTEMPGCRLGRGALGAVLDDRTEAEIDAAIGDLAAWSVAAVLADGSGVVLEQALCPSRNPEPGTTTEALVRLGGCAMAPAQLEDWTRRFGLTPGDVAAACEGAAPPALADVAGTAGREAVLAAFRQAEGCAVTVAALEDALGAEEDVAVGAMIAAGEVALEGGRLVLTPALCKPAPDLARGRQEVVDAFASKACSMTPAEAEVSLATDGAAALEAMLAGGEVQLVFGRLVMEVAVCTGAPEDAAVWKEGTAADVPAPLPAAVPGAAAATAPEVAEGLRRATDLETAEAVLAALAAIGCSANLTETADLQAVFYPAFARAMGVPDDLIQHEAVRMAVIAAATRGADSLLRQKLVVYSDVSGWFGLASCKDQRPDPTLDQAKSFLKGMSEGRGDTFFEGVVQVLGCEMDFSDPEALVKVLVDAYAEALGQKGSTDAELLALIDAQVGAALERASGALERVGVSSRFRMKDCAG